MSIFSKKKSPAAPTTGAGSTVAPGVTLPSAVPGAGLPVSATTAPCNRFEGRIIEITAITNSVPVTVGGSVVTAPYWVHPGTGYEDGANYSTHPAAVPTESGSDLEMTVKIEVIKADGLTGSGPLVGRLFDGSMINLKGTVPMSVGIHTVIVKLDHKTTILARHRGDISWQVDAPGCGKHIIGRTRVEIYRIVEDTRPPYLSTGRPAEALRFLYETVNAGGADVAGKSKAGIRITTSKITTYCHGRHGLTYDTFNGAPGFLSGRVGAVTFALTDYIARNGNGVPVPNMVNCYDQASAVLVFAGIMGIDGHKRFVEPFGYINETILVGGIRTNSPFYRSNGSPPIVPQMDSRRTAFGNHEFYMDRASATVFDACAGPSLGTEEYDDYLSNAVDTTRLLRGSGTGSPAIWKSLWQFTDDYFTVTAIT